MRLPIKPRSMNHAFPFLSAMLLTMQANALSVTVQVTPQKCTVPGSCKAVISNGVAPFTYAWSNGGTTQTISVDAGTYTVTVTDATGEEATASGTVAYQDNYGYLDLQATTSEGYCPDGFWLTEPFFRWDPSMNPELGPPPYYFNGQEVELQDYEDPWGGGQQHYYVMITTPDGSPAPPGSWQDMEFMDGNGCTGTFQAIAGYPVQWPLMQVVQVNGACNGQANGSVTIQVAAEPHQIGVFGELVNGQGQAVNDGGYHWHGPSAMQDTYTGLAPGTYSIVQRLTAVNSSILYMSCSHPTLTFTIPDWGSTCNTVSGEVYVDANKDCVKGPASAEPRVPSTVIEFLPGPVYAITDQSGAYSINLPSGNYTASHNVGNLSQHCPPPPASFTMGSGPVALDFGDTSLVPMDALITLNSGPARPGFGMNWWITAHNTTPAATGGITVEFEYDPILEYVSASPDPTGIDGNTITWSAAAIPPFGLRQFHVEFNVPADVDLLGTVLSSSANLTTAQTDADLSNNTATDTRTITGSYDPNDKLGVTDRTQGEDLFILDQDEWIDYTIRFQNTGTDTAFTVVVRDELSEELAIGTLDILGASHDFVPSFGEGRELMFTFNDILLPDSTTDLLGSQGFVSFRIKPVAGIQAGDVIQNTAAIYFDFNEPVITNTTAHEVAVNTGIREEAAPGRLRVHPNPTNDILFIHLPDGADRAVRVYAVDGRPVEVEGRSTAQGMELQVGALSPGAYLIRTTAGTAQFVKY